jgi:hypothetical protein
VRFGDKALSKDEMDALIRELRSTPLVARFIGFETFI